jgi:hypothetical protein
MGATEGDAKGVEWVAVEISEGEKKLKNERNEEEKVKQKGK